MYPIKLSLHLKVKTKGKDARNLNQKENELEHPADQAVSAERQAEITFRFKILSQTGKEKNNKHVVSCTAGGKGEV